MLTDAEATKSASCWRLSPQNECRIEGINLIAAALASFIYQRMQKSNFSAVWWFPVNPWLLYRPPPPPPPPLRHTEWRSSSELLLTASSPSCLRLLIGLALIAGLAASRLDAAGGDHQAHHYLPPCTWRRERQPSVAGRASPGTPLRYSRGLPPLHHLAVSVHFCSAASDGRGERRPSPAMALSVCAFRRGRTK